jgi:hypothetical protein
VNVHRFFRRALALACLAAFAAPVAAQADDRTMYATRDNGTLVKFNKNNPGQILSKKAITGLPDGVSLVGIDFRPKNGDLYGIGSDDVVYRVNPRTAIALAVGAAPFGVTTGSFFGVDFNPVPDKIRIVSDANENLRVNPDNGTLTLADMPINGPQADENVVHAAYTNSSFSVTPPMGTTLYVIDSANDTLYVQNPPNDGTLTMPVALNVNVTNVGGFDIAGVNNRGFFAKQRSGGGSSLYKLDVTTGAATSLGRIGLGSAVVTGLAAVQDQP